MAKDKDSVLRMVEALLKKAESTNFGPEAESLIAKAYELMSKYSIDEAMLSKGQDTLHDVIDVRIKVRGNGAFPDQRRSLLHALASENRCRAIVVGDFLSVIGFRTDTEFVQVLYTSLVEQMFGSLLNYPAFEEVSSSVRKIKGTRLKAKAEQEKLVVGSNFCDGFVVVIWDRLKEVRSTIEKEGGESTALVLFDRKKLVDQQVHEIFPNLGRVKRKQYRYDGVSHGAGRVAGSNADIGVSKVGGGSRGEIAQ